MATAKAPPPPRYADPLYQTAHDAMFKDLLFPEVQTVLPPGVSETDFNSALAEFAAAVGEDAVFSGSEGLREYVDPYEIPETGHERKVPSAAVCPSTVEQLQAALKVATKYKIPVWTFSRGKNLGYGGPAPIVAGSVAMDLHRMNKIIEVNEKFAYAVVEPGVTFGDLYNYCAEHKLKVWPSTASLGWGSIVGNTLDRGMGFVPTGIHYQNMCGLEVVLSDGDVVRTGQFGMTSSPSAHLTQLSFGPAVEGLFLQSNLGIVTKMGMHLTPQPQAFLSCSFDMPELEDIAAIVDVFGALRRSGVIPYMAYVFSVVEWTAIFGKRHEFWDGEGPIPDWRLKEIAKDLDVGFWTVKFGFYGPEGIIQAHYEEVRRVTEKECPTGRLKSTLFAAEKGKELLEALDVPQPYGGMFVGVPSMWSIPMVDYYNPKEGGGIGAHGAYSPIIPLDGKTVLSWVKAAKEVYERHGFDLLCDFFMHERHAVFVCMLCFDRLQPKQREAIDKIYHDLFAEGTKRGFAPYRSHINHMDENAALFDFNDHATRRFAEKLKSTLDPASILSPGKMGIWPKKQA